MYGGVGCHFRVWEVKTRCMVGRKEVECDFQTHEEPS